MRRSLPAFVLLLAACGSPPPASPEPTPDPTPAGPPPLRLDEAALPPVNRFQKADLDDTKAVCDDFPGHVNGRWLAANPIPADRSTWGAFPMLDERSMAVQKQIAEQVATWPSPDGVEAIVANFWATGMDEKAAEAAGLTPLQPRLASIDALTDGASVAAWLREASARGEHVVFNVSPSPDFSDSSMNIAYVEQGGLGLPDREYYTSDDEDKRAKREAYRAHIARMLELGGTAAAVAPALSEAVLAFETRLARKSKSREELSRDVSLYYRMVTLAEADAETPAFPWSAFWTAQGITPPERFSLAFPEFQSEFGKMLAEEPITTWKAYLRFHTIDDSAPYLGAAFADAHFDFYGKTMRGQKEMKARWKRVLDSLEEYAGETMGQLYVRVAFPPESKARMEKLVGDLRTALKARIEQLPWMSAETKTKAIAKWETFTPKIGYPTVWRDWSALKTSRSSWVENIWAARAFDHRWKLGKVGKAVDRTEWLMSPQTVNAYYDPQKNEIVFPAAILQPPFFDAAADDALNYGGIGAVIGHELIHGYDDQGSRFGPTGNFENWWTEQDAAGFASRTDALIAQFDAFEALPGLKVNGKLTLGENIADVGGLAVAYDALMQATAGTPDPMVDGLSRAQRFFYGWATVWRGDATEATMRMRVASDPHSPAKVRVFGPPSNLQQFGDAFTCAEGTTMARKDKVQIW